MKTKAFFQLCLCALCAALPAHSAKADGTYTATETWSVTLTLGTGSGLSTTTYNGTESGTLAVRVTSTR